MGLKEKENDKLGEHRNKQGVLGIVQEIGIIVEQLKQRLTGDRHLDLNPVVIIRGRMFVGQSSKRKRPSKAK